MHSPAARKHDGREERAIGARQGSAANVGSAARRSAVSLKRLISRETRVGRAVGRDVAVRAAGRLRRGTPHLGVNSVP